MDTERHIPMIDMHTHLLPGMDDGARNEGEAETMFRMLLSQDVEKIVLTPHFHSDRMPMDVFLKQRQQALERLQKCSDVDSSRLILASETLFSQSLLSYQDISPLCIHGRYLLLEVPFETVFSKHLCAQLMRVSYQYGVTPILAHIERYPYLMRHPRVLDDLINDGMLMQVNLSSLQTFRKRRRILRLIRQGRVHLLGTDCHHPFTRPPEFKKGLDILEKYLAPTEVQELLQNAWDVVSTD